MPKSSKHSKSKTSSKPTAALEAKASSKQDLIIKLLRRPQGATIDELAKATVWQVHSVRGAISGVLKKRLGLAVASETTEKRGRVYRIERTADKSAA